METMLVEKHPLMLMVLTIMLALKGGTGILVLTIRQSTQYMHLMLVLTVIKKLYVARRITEFTC